MNLFDGLSNLQKLYLYNNKLTDLDDCVFENLATLTKLRLNNNQLSEIRPEFFSSHTNLYTLYLSANGISQLDPGVFRFLPGLKHLHLEENQLTTLDEGVVSLNSSSPMTLYLDHNPLHCDQNMCWLKKGIEQFTIFLWGTQCVNYLHEYFEHVDLDCDWCCVRKTATTTQQTKWPEMGIADQIRCFLKMYAGCRFFLSFFWNRHQTWYFCHYKRVNNKSGNELGSQSWSSLDLRCWIEIWLAMGAIQFVFNLAVNRLACVLEGQLQEGQRLSFWYFNHIEISLDKIKLDSYCWHISVTSICYCMYIL